MYRLVVFLKKVTVRPLKMTFPSYVSGTGVRGDIPNGDVLTRTEVLTLPHSTKETHLLPERFHLKGWVGGKGVKGFLGFYRKQYLYL